MAEPDLTTPASVLYENVEDDRRLYRILRWGYITLLPYTALFIAVALLSQSSTMLLYVILAFITLTVQAFSLYAMRQVIAPNPFALPFGAGKLEDFSAFLCGILFVPSGIFIAYIGIQGLRHPAPVAYGVALVPVAVSVARELWLLLALRRLGHEAARPPLLLQAQMVAYRIALLSDLGVLAGFGAGWLLAAAGSADYAARIDPGLTLILSLYSVWSGITLVRRSFRPLMDLPLPEAEQLAILRALARHYADYEDVGLLLTRASGRQRFVLMELGFPADCSVDELAALNEALARELTTDLPGLTLDIQPIVSRSSAPGLPEKEGT